MATARYWRVCGLSTLGGGDLELSELHLYDGATRVGASVTPTCSHAPTAGSLANLSDATLSSVCRFAGADVRSGGFWLAWDLGSAANVTTVLPGSSTTRSMFLAGAMLQSRDATTDPWGPAIALGQYPWPGASAMVTQVASVDDALLRLHGDGADGSTTITDSSPVARTPSAVGGASISTDRTDAYGGAAIKIAGANPLTYAHTADLVPMSDYTIRLRLWVPSTTGSLRAVFTKATGAGHRPYALYIDPDGKLRFQQSNATPVLTNVLSSSSVPAASWVYIECNRVGDMLRIFVDGNLAGSGAAGSGSNYNNAGDSLCIGAASDFGYPLSSSGAAYIEELSITAGGGSTANYTPPTGPDVVAVVGPAFTPFDLVTTISRQRLAFSAPVPAAQVRSQRASRLARDMEFGGRARITGDVGIKGASGAPDSMTKSRVRLLRARDGLLARETWSDAATGAFEFTGLDERTEFIALAQDSTGSFRPVAADRVLPEVPA